MEHSKRIKLLNDAAHPLSEQEIVEATVAFANGATLEIIQPQINGLGMLPNFPGQSDIADITDFPGLPIVSKGAFKDLLAKSQAARSRLKEVIAIGEKAIEESRNLCRTYLDLIVSVKKDPTPFGDEAQKTELLSSIYAKPYFRRAGKTVTLDFHYLFADPGSLPTLGGLLLEDPHRAYREKLCRCELQSCGIFFFEIKPARGRPQRRYCDKTHMLAAHDQNAPKRMEKFRNKKARKPK